MKYAKFMMFFRIFCATFFYFSGIAFIRSRIILRKRPLVRIILIHHIKSPERFERIIKFLSQRYSCLSAQDFKDKKFSKEKMNILLTMDDGYLDWWKKGLSILKKYKVPTIFFVSSGFIDTSKNLDKMKIFCKKNLKLNSMSPPLSSVLLKRMDKIDMLDIGGHTLLHPFLSFLKKKDVALEIFVDKQKIENILGRKIEMFAYPFGDYSEDVILEVRRAGYKYAFTTESDFYDPRRDPFRIPRSNHGTVRPILLRMWLIGAFDLVQKTEKLFKFLFKRIF